MELRLCSGSSWRNMSDSSEDEVFLLYCWAQEEEEEDARNVRTWVHDINTKRPVFGEHHHLFPDLLRDKTKFIQYFRMSQERFYELLNLIKPAIERQDTKFRKAISAEERLATCLRYE